MLWNWFIWDNAFSVVFNAVYLIVILTTVFVVILDNRNPVRTMAWILFLFFLPLLGLVFYFFFGRSTRKERLISKKGYSFLIKRPMMEFLAQEAFRYPESQYSLMHFFRRVNNALPFEGNTLKMYSDGTSFLYDLIRTIAAARSHVHLQFYIFEDDAVGRLLRDVLMDKAREGVKVRLLYDDVGCWKVKNSFFEQMLCAGIEAQSFLRVRFPQFTSKVNYRNHRKIAVIDGCIGFIGGMNIAERYIKGINGGIWRDAHLRIEGKAVYGLQTSFLRDWYVVDRTLLTSAEYYPKIQPSGNALVQIVTSDPVGRWRDIMQGLMMVIMRAQRYVYFQTPYLLPTDPVLVALKTAALGGIDVRIMLPEKGDARLVQWGSMSYFYDLMSAGVKIYQYQKGFIHSKLMVSDDEVGMIGSTNMDFRSFEHNFEANAFMYDTNSALALKKIFLEDQKSSNMLLLREWEKRSWKERTIESVVRLLAPLL